MSLMLDAPELLAIRQDPLADIEDEIATSYKLYFKNFDLNKSELKTLHKTWLRDMVAPYMLARPSGFAEIYALTDRSGKPEVNYKVSHDRLVAVQKYLEQLGAPQAKVYSRYAKALGEDYAAYVKVPDGNKDPDQRAVMIALSPAIFQIPTKRFTGIFSDLIFFGRDLSRPGH